MEVEILKEALDVARVKKPILPLQFPHSSFEFTHPARADNVFIRLDCLQAAREHSLAPVEQLTGGDARSSSHIGNRHPRLHRLLDQPDLLGGWPAATALNRSNHFNAGRRTILIGGHVVIIGVCLCLIELRYLSGQNGVRSSTP
jgi:hypothetical protein